MIKESMPVTPQTLYGLTLNVNSIKVCFLFGLRCFTKFYLCPYVYFLSDIFILTIRYKASVLEIYNMKLMFVVKIPSQ